MNRHVVRGTTRTVLCITALLAAACDPKSKTVDTTPAEVKTATVVSGATSLSNYVVASGEFTDATLIQTILDSAGSFGPTKWDDRHDRTDTRRLMTGDCTYGSSTCRSGPYMRIVPRKNVHTTLDAAVGRGRVVGKLVSLEPSRNIAYEKLGLYLGTAESYWWVGVRPGGTDTISVYVPNDWASGKPATWRSVSARSGGANNMQSSARFVWNDGDDETWVTCSLTTCCQPSASFGS